MRSRRCFSHNNWCKRTITAFFDLGYSFGGLHRRSRKGGDYHTTLIATVTGFCFVVQSPVDRYALTLAPLLWNTQVPLK